MANHMQRMQKARGDVHRLIFCMCLCLRVRVCVFTLWLNMVFRLRRSTTGSSILAANIIIEKHHESWHIRTAAISTIITHHAKQCKTMQNESGPGRIPRLARLCRPAQGMDFGALGATLVLSSSALILSLLPQDNQQHHDQGQEPGYVGQFWWSRYVFLQFLRILGVARSTSAECVEAPAKSAQRDYHKNYCQANRKLHGTHPYYPLVIYIAVENCHL